jgi:hypothetical protein
MKRKRAEGEVNLSFEVHPGLEVGEVKHKERKKMKCNPLLPQPAFLLLMAAPRFSGKTNLMIKTLIDDEMYCKKFDEIYIWSKSYKNDDKWRAINFEQDYEDEHVFEDFKERQVSEIFEELKERSKAKNLHTLMIFDDMMCEGIMNVHKTQTLDKIASTGRHFDISVIIIFQKFKKFTPIIRDNATNVVVFEQKNSKSIEQIAEEYRGALSVKDFMKVYNFATGDPFSFMHINLQEPDRSRRFRKNWNTIINVNNEAVT